MEPRFNWFKAAPAVPQALLKIQAVVNDSGLDHRMLELVKLRASQLNGCAYCIDMHTKDARAAGETEQRLYLLSAWREAEHLYSEKERAAIRWTETITHIGDGHVPDDAYDMARAQFGEADLVMLTFAIATINRWNRMNCAFRTHAGDYRPGMFKVANG